MKLYLTPGACSLADHIALHEAGLEFERRNFYLLFDTEDSAEGMAAFGQKRAPSWRGR